MAIHRRYGQPPAVMPPFVVSNPPPKKPLYPSRERAGVRGTKSAHPPHSFPGIVKTNPRLNPPLSGTIRFLNRIPHSHQSTTLHSPIYIPNPVRRRPIMKRGNKHYPGLAG